MDNAIELLSVEQLFACTQSFLCNLLGNPKDIFSYLNTCVSARLPITFRLGVLSPDGRCKTFDNSANGYARSEAISVLLLEKSKDARRIYANVRSSLETKRKF